MMIDMQFVVVDEVIFISFFSRIQSRFLFFVENFFKDLSIFFCFFGFVLWYYLLFFVVYFDCFVD